MTDEDILHRIDELVEEEHDLYRRHTEGEELATKERDRLNALEVALDQCWDLLRQRRARRHAGADADTVEARPAEVVEHYQQ